MPAVLLAVAQVVEQVDRARGGSRRRAGRGARASRPPGRPAAGRRRAAPGRTGSWPTGWAAASARAAGASAGIVRGRGGIAGNGAAGRGPRAAGARGGRGAGARALALDRAAARRSAGAPSATATSSPPTCRSRRSAPPQLRAGADPGLQPDLGAGPAVPRQPERARLLPRQRPLPGAALLERLQPALRPALAARRARPCGRWPARSARGAARRSSPAITYAGSGWVLSCLSFYNLLAVAAWWPLVLWGAVRGGRRGVALGGAACGLALLGGEPVAAALGAGAAAPRRGERARAAPRGVPLAAAIGAAGAPDRAAAGGGDGARPPLHLPRRATACSAGERRLRARALAPGRAAGALPVRRALGLGGR